MKKTLTADQQARRDERKAKFSALWKQIAAMGDSEKAVFAAKFGFVTCEGRQLSLCNQMLVALQSPGATVLGGFRQWIKQGRTVKKGEHGIMIWVPTGAKGNGKETEPSAQPETATVEPSKHRFIIGTIFDISQTQEIENGNPTPAQNEAIVEHSGELALA